jgi:threonine/homoserine/homoserine lactone efflux protein
MSRGIALGPKAAVATAVGNSLGTFVNVLVLAVGLGPVLDNFPGILQLIRYLGAAYLIYLGYQAISTRKALSADSSKASEALSGWKTLKQGALVGITNPKTIVFFAAVLPQFVIADWGYITLQLLGLGTAFCLMGAALDSVWGIAAGSLRNWFLDQPSRLSLMSAVGGGLIISLGIAVALGWF